MEETDAFDFYEDVVEGESGEHAVPDQKEQYEIQSANGRTLTVYLTPVDRKFAIDQLNKLPKEMLELLSEVDDPEQAQEEADEADALSGISGDAIEAFENLCAEGMTHQELTQHHFDGIVEQLSLEILFEMGSIIMEMSLQDDGKITGFRKLD